MQFDAIRVIGFNIITHQSVPRQTLPTNNPPPKLKIVLIVSLCALVLLFNEPALLRVVVATWYFDLLSWSKM